MKTDPWPLSVSAPVSPPHEDAISLGATSGVPQRQTAEPARIHLIVGPVGAGKSTFGAQLARSRPAVRLTLDEWMATLFRPDRPDQRVIEWYLERSARCIEQIWAVTTELLRASMDVVLEIGLLRRREREAFYRRVDDADFELVIHVLDAARDVRRERVMHRNQQGGPTFSVHVPLDIFEYASDLWEPPEDEECAGRNVSFTRTDA
jgi:predicted kinase